MLLGEHVFKLRQFYYHFILYSPIYFSLLIVYRFSCMMNSCTINFFCHCKIAESIKIFHLSKCLDKSTKFCLTTRIPPVHMCVNFYLYQWKLFVKKIVFFELLSFFIWFQWHRSYSKLGIRYEILLYHIYFVKQIHCIKIVESFSLKMMSSKIIKQCSICKQRFRRNNGGFMKHIRTCQQQVSLQSPTEKNALDHQILCFLYLRITSHLRLTMHGVTFTVITPLT